MARPKKPGVARHIFINPYVRVKESDPLASIDGDARIDKALRWLASHPKGAVTAMCWDLIVSAVNGELGVASTVTLTDEDAAIEKKALDDLLKNMVFDDD